jgi:hypothetical protein
VSPGIVERAKLARMGFLVSHSLMTDNLKPLSYKRAKSLMVLSLYERAKLL